MVASLLFVVIVLISTSMVISTQLDSIDSVNHHLMKSLLHDSADAHVMKGLLTTDGSDVTLAPVSKLDCPKEYTFYESVGKCYYVVNRPFTWYAAHMTCRRRRGQLVSFHSAEEETFVMNQVLKGATFSFWTGLNKLDSPSDANSYKWYLEGQGYVPDQGAFTTK